MFCEAAGFPTAAEAAANPIVNADLRSTFFINFLLLCGNQSSTKFRGIEPSGVRLAGRDAIQKLAEKRHVVIATHRPLRRRSPWRGLFTSVLGRPCSLLPVWSRKT